MSKLIENMDVKSVIELLELTGMDKQLKSYKELIGLVDDLSSEISSLKEEIVDLKKEAEELKTPKVKKAVEKLINNLSEKYEALLENLEAIKKTIIEKSHDMVYGFNKIGKTALEFGVSQIVILMKRPIENVASRLYKGVDKKMEKKERLALLSEAVRESNGAIKNIGRALRGKEAISFEEQGKNSRILAAIDSILDKRIEIEARQYNSCMNALKSLDSVRAKYGNSEIGQDSTERFPDIDDLINEAEGIQKENAKEQENLREQDNSIDDNRAVLT